MQLWLSAARMPHRSAASRSSVCFSCNATPSRESANCSAATPRASASTDASAFVLPSASASSGSGCSLGGSPLAQAVPDLRHGPRECLLRAGSACVLPLAAHANRIAALKSPNQSPPVSHTRVRSGRSPGRHRRPPSQSDTGSETSRGEAGEAQVALRVILPSRQNLRVCVCASGRRWRARHRAPRPLRARHGSVGLTSARRRHLAAAKARRSRPRARARREGCASARALAQSAAGGCRRQRRGRAAQAARAAGCGKQGRQCRALVWSERRAGRRGQRGGAWRLGHLCSATGGRRPWAAVAVRAAQSVRARVGPYCGRAVGLLRTPPAESESSTLAGRRPSAGKSAANTSSRLGARGAPACEAVAPQLCVF